MNVGIKSHHGIFKFRKMNLNSDIELAKNLSYRERMRTEDFQIKSLYRKGSRSNNYYRWYRHSYFHHEKIHRARRIFKSCVGEHYDIILSKISKLLSNEFPISARQLISTWSDTDFRRQSYRKRYTKYYFDENMILCECTEKRNRYVYESKFDTRYKERRRILQITNDCIYMSINNSYKMMYVKRIYNELSSYITRIVEYSTYINDYELFRQKMNSEYTDRLPNTVYSKLCKMRHSQFRYKKKLSEYKKIYEDKLQELAAYHNNDLYYYLRSKEYYSSYEKECHHVD